jgi:hypothetical protein
MLLSRHRLFKPVTVENPLCSYARELGLTPAAGKTLASTGKTFDLAAEFAALNAREAEAAPAAENAPEPVCAPLAGDSHDK